MQPTTYVYDALNRRTSASYADGSTTTYTYDAGNRLTQIVDSISGTITRTYDGLDRLTSETTPQGSVNYTYEAAGRRTSMTVAGQPSLVYSYDNANRLIQITQGSSIVSFAYDGAGRRTSLTLPNGVLVEYTYDAASRVTGITYKQGVTVLGNLTYEYDKAGNWRKVGGSWARSGLPQGLTSTAYDAGNRQLTFGDKTLTYDNNGNLTSITDVSGATLYTWNARNQLVGVSGPGVSASFVYDGLGLREKKTVNGNLTEFLYDGVNPVQETSGATVLANILGGLGIDEVFTRTDVPAVTTSHFLPDALGSALALADAAGAVQTEYTYEPFGRTTVTGASNTNPFQYTGRENDVTGLYYYRARYYHPGLQRFINEDPIGLRGGINLYSYTNGNPLASTDPFGLDTYGIGVGGSFAYITQSGRGISETSSVLIVVDTQGNIGLINVHGPLVIAGTPGPSANLGIQSQTSNAETIGQLAGPFSEGGGTVGAPIPVGGVPIPAAISTDVFETFPIGSQPRIEGSEFNIGLGTPGVSVSAGVTNTEILFQFNIFNLVNLSGRGKGGLR